MAALGSFNRHSMTNLNFSFDVLLTIFSYYEETPGSPLETLLLICRLWNVAALECKPLWSRTKLSIKDDSSALRWSRRLPRRLEKSGSSSPIFFALNMNVHWHMRRISCPTRGHKCYCDESTMESLNVILRTVLGLDGSHCARWREIDIRISQGTIVRVPFLSYPTPQLTLLTLHGVVYQPYHVPSFLPSISALRQIEVVYCSLPHLPDTSNAISLCFADHYDVTSCTNGDATDPEGLTQAEKVQSLELEISGLPGYHYIIPAKLPSLERLFLSGDIIPENLANVQTPALRELRIKFYEEDDTCYPDDDDDDLPIGGLVKCTGIPFHQLDTLTIEFDVSHRLRMKMTKTSWDAYTKLLKMCSSIKKIQGHGYSTEFILRLLKDDCLGAGALSDRAFVVGHDEKVREMRLGKEERLEDIKRFAEEFGWPEMEEDTNPFSGKERRKVERVFLFD